MGTINALIYEVFSEGINEVIVSTHNNAAPMGIIKKNNALSMIVFRTSHTAENICREGWIVAHISVDPILFVKTAFEDPPEDAFTSDQIGDLSIQRLKENPNWIACRAFVEHTTTEKIFVRLEPIQASLSPVPPRPVNRGFNNCIEATIHGTRFILNQDPVLEGLIRHHIELVRRCGGEQEKIAIKLLLSYINSFVPGTFKE